LSTIPVGADSISALSNQRISSPIRPKVLLPCLGEVATLLFAFKQKVNDGVDGGVFSLFPWSLDITCWMLDIKLNSKP